MRRNEMEDLDLRAVSLPAFMKEEPLTAEKIGRDMDRFIEERSQELGGVLAEALIPMIEKIKELMKREGIELPEDLGSFDNDIIWKDKLPRHDLKDEDTN